MVGFHMKGMLSWRNSLSLVISQSMERESFHKLSMPEHQEYRKQENIVNTVWPCNEWMPNKHAEFKKMTLKIQLLNII